MLQRGKARTGNKLSPGGYITLQRVNAPKASLLPHPPLWGAAMLHTYDGN